MRTRLTALASGLKARLTLYRALIADARTPWLARALLGLAVAYALMPFDLIPDGLPLIGQLDDLVLVPLLIYLAFRLIPARIVAEHEAALRRDAGLRPGP